MEHNWMIWLLPVGGVCIVLFYRWCKKSHDNGTDTVIFSVRRTDRIPTVMVPLIFVSTLITRAFGGSVGTEGAAIQLGGGLASSLGRLFHMGAKEKKIMIMCGISAGFAAVVGTPVTAIVLALELVGVGVVYYSAILPCALSSVVGFMIASAFHIDFPRYTLKDVPGLGPVSILQIAVLAALCGLVSILFCIALRKSKQFYEHVFPGKISRVIVGGLIIVGLTYLVGNNLYNGDSIGLIGAAVKGTSAPQDFLWKIAFTSLTISAGFKGGEIVPTFCRWGDFWQLCREFTRSFSVHGRRSWACSGILRSGKLSPDRICSGAGSIRIGSWFVFPPSMCGQLCFFGILWALSEPENMV